MLDHPNIDVLLSTDYKDLVDEVEAGHIVFTGPVDEYFGFRFGKLPYRSLHFEHQTHDKQQYQQAAVVNYPNEHAYTRITEFKYLTGQKHPATSVVYEIPRADGDPYYPVPRAENTERYRLYEADAEKLDAVSFVGRLATYKYYNMDQVVAQSLTLLSAFARAGPQARATASANAGCDV